MGGNRSGVIGLCAFLVVLPFFRIINKKAIAFAIVIVCISSVIAWNLKSYSNRITHLLEIRLNVFNYESMTPNDQFRFDYWRISYAQFIQKNKKMFGIGPRNYGSIDVNNLKFDPPLKNIAKLQSPNHSHNWLLTKLIEEGIFGLFFILGFWVSVLWILLKHRKYEKKYHWSFVACFGAIIIPAIAGLFYSPFRREVAWVSMMYIGLTLSFIRNNERKDT
jgi:O-antigen ligase